MGALLETVPGGKPYNKRGPFYFKRKIEKMACAHLHRTRVEMQRLKDRLVSLEAEIRQCVIREQAWNQVKNVVAREMTKHELRLEELATQVKAQDALIAAKDEELTRMARRIKELETFI